MPKINKNTDQYLESRKRRLEEEAQLQRENEQSRNKEAATYKLKQSDRYLLNKFNREFALAVEAVRQERQEQGKSPVADDPQEEDGE